MGDWKELHKPSCHTKQVSAQCGTGAGDGQERQDATRPRPSLRLSADRFSARTASPRAPWRAPPIPKSECSQHLGYFPPSPQPFSAAAPMQEKLCVHGQSLGSVCARGVTKTRLGQTGPASFCLSICFSGHQKLIKNKTQRSSGGTGQPPLPSPPRPVTTRRQQEQPGRLLFA